MIRDRLNSALHPETLEITDESHLHAGHAGARSGGGHFAVTIVSREFAGRNAVQRHRLVYQAVADIMQSEIHALTISAFTPDEI